MSVRVGLLTIRLLNKVCFVHWVKMLYHHAHIESLLQMSHFLSICHLTIFFVSRLEEHNQ